MHTHRLSQGTSALKDLAEEVDSLAVWSPNTLSILHIQHIFLGAHVPGTELSQELRTQTLKNLAHQPLSPTRHSDALRQTARILTLLLAAFPPDLGQVTFLFPPHFQKCDTTGGLGGYKEKTKRLIRRRGSMHSTQCSDGGSYAFQVSGWKEFCGNILNFQGCANLEFTFEEGWLPAAS